jgi:hypothetical protein
VIGPCGRCNQPKHMILHSILNYEPRLITRLIVDSRTARGLVMEATSAPESACSHHPSSEAGHEDHPDRGLPG